jgi:hypothetical protein
VPAQVLLPVRCACKCRRGTRGSPGACGIADAGATHTSSSVVKEVATGSTKPNCLSDLADFDLENFDGRRPSRLGALTRRL